MQCGRQEENSCVLWVVLDSFQQQWCFGAVNVCSVSELNTSGCLVAKPRNPSENAWTEKAGALTFSLVLQWGGIFRVSRISGLIIFLLLASLWGLLQLLFWESGVLSTLQIVLMGCL